MRSATVTGFCLVDMRPAASSRLTCVLWVLLTSVMHIMTLGTSHKKMAMMRRAHEGRALSGSAFIAGGPEQASVSVIGGHRHNAKRLQVLESSTSPLVSLHRFIARRQTATADAARWPHGESRTVPNSSSRSDDGKEDREEYEALLIRLQEEGQVSFYAAVKQLGVSGWVAVGKPLPELPEPAELADSSTRGLAETKRVVELTRDHLYRPAEVPLRPLESDDSPDFIGRRFVDTAYDLLLPEYHQYWDTRNDRIMPMLFTRFSRGGKTRTLREMGTKLREEGIPVIQISFNDETAYTVEEVRLLPSLNDSLFMRVAWAARTPTAIEEVADAAGVAMDKLKFDKWIMHASINEQTILDWLGTEGAVLLIDELNNFVTRDERRSNAENEVGKWLKDVFLLKGNRYFAFSSHVNRPFADLSKFLQSPSRRTVLSPSLPRIEKEDLELVSGRLYLYGANTAQICWAGRSPALLWEWSRTDLLPKFLIKCLPQLALRGPTDAVRILWSVIDTAVSGTEPRYGLREWEELLDVFKEDGLGEEVFVWPPCYLYYVLDKLAQRPEDLGSLVVSGLNAAAANLWKLNTADDESGDQWEGPCAAALCLRLIQSDLRKDDPDAQDQIAALPKDLHNTLPPAVIRSQCSFGTRIRNSDWTTLSDVVEAFVKQGGYLSQALRDHPELAEGCAAFFVKPSNNQFETYDLFIFVTEDGKLTQVWGYQCKRGDELPEDTESIAADLSGDISHPLPVEPALLAKCPELSSVKMVSVWMRGGVGPQAKARVVQVNGMPIKWVIPSRAVYKLLFGRSLEVTCPFEFRQIAGGDVTAKKGNSSD